MRKKESTGNIEKNIICPVFPKVVQSILKQKKGSQNIYKFLNKNDYEPTGKNKWNRLYHIDDSVISIDSIILNSMSTDSSCWEGVGLLITR